MQIWAYRCQKDQGPGSGILTGGDSSALEDGDIGGVRQAETGLSNDLQPLRGQILAGNTQLR